MVQTYLRYELTPNDETASVETAVRVFNAALPEIVDREEFGYGDYTLRETRFRNADGEHPEFLLRLEADKNVQLTTFKRAYEAKLDALAEEYGFDVSYRGLPEVDREMVLRANMPNAQELEAIINDFLAMKDHYNASGAYVVATRFSEEFTRGDASHEHVFAVRYRYPDDVEKEIHADLAELVKKHGGEVFERSVTELDLHPKPNVYVASSDVEMGNVTDKPITK
jgi:hypothetical protein